MQTPRLPVLVILLVLSVVARLVPYALARFGVAIDPGASTYPWNFSPILPICLFGGAAYADRRLTYLIPFGTFALGDLGIWALTGHREWALYAYQPVTYLSVALVATTGLLVRADRRWGRIAGAGLVAAIGFFLVSNFGVWALGGGERYPLTVAGLTTCYLNALPYFRNSVASMAIFLPVLFSRVSLKDAGPVRHLAAHRA